MARPRKEIDKKTFEKLCGLQCTQEEICDYFEVCTETLNSWCKRTYKDENGKDMCFSEVFKQKRGLGKISLRRSQWRLAEKSATMAIWLGKQYLDQKDTQEVTIDNKDATIKEMDDYFAEQRRNSKNAVGGAD